MKPLVGKSCIIYLYFVEYKRHSWFQMNVSSHKRLSLPRVNISNPTLFSVHIIWKVDALILAKRMVHAMVMAASSSYPHIIRWVR